VAKSDQPRSRPEERFTALGHPLRFRILASLLEHPAAGAELARRIGRPAGTIGYHLGVLERAGLVQVQTTRRVRALVERIYGPTSLAAEVMAAVGGHVDGPLSERVVAPTDADPRSTAAPDRAAPAATAAEGSTRPVGVVLTLPSGVSAPIEVPGVRKPALELAPTTQAGVLRFIHYGFMPNRLGYCGPDENRRLFDHGVAGDADRSLLPSLSRFLGPLPYLRAIAAGAGIRDLFDERVVEAYWIGNDLLGQFASHQLYDALRERFRRELPPRMMDLIASKIPAGALPHHSFHVFDVWLRVGRLDGDVIATLDHCRISWGKVTSVDGPTVGVERSPLVFHEGKLRLAPPEVVYTTRLMDGRGFVTELAPGDIVSLHWGWVCERLSDRQAQDLERYTGHHVRLANQTI
jgi:DNA-binding transcriptional ArsR family regulator